MRITKAKLGWASGLIAMFAAGLVFDGCIGVKHDESLQHKIERIEEKLNSGGKKIVYGYYKDGQVVEHGKCVLIDEDGSRFETNCDHGVLEGKCRWYYPDGSLGFEGTYKKGKPWDGVLIPTDVRGERPHVYISGKDCGYWNDPKGVWPAE